MRPSAIGYTRVDISWIQFGYEESIVYVENIIIPSIEYIYIYIYIRILTSVTNED